MLARFPRSRLASLPFVKISMCSYQKPGWKFCRMNTYLTYSSPGNRNDTFLDKIASLSQHSGENGIIFVLCVFPLEEYVNWSPQSYYSREWYKLMLHHLGCVSSIQYEQTTKFVPVTEPTRVPCSYEQALNHLLPHAKNWHTRAD